MPMPKKNERRGAKASIVKPDWIPVRQYSIPSAMVNPSSRVAKGYLKTYEKCNEDITN
jgi:hypothetical protein